MKKAKVVPFFIASNVHKLTLDLKIILIIITKIFPVSE